MCLDFQMDSNYRGQLNTTDIFKHAELSEQKTLTNKIGYHSCVLHLSGAGKLLSSYPQGTVQ